MFVVYMSLRARVDLKKVDSSLQLLRQERMIGYFVPQLSSKRSRLGECGLGINFEGSVKERLVTFVDSYDSLEKQKQIYSDFYLSALFRVMLYRQKKY